jgi:hypothetical protein
MRKMQILIVLAGAVGAAWPTTRGDDGKGPGWTHNIVSHSQPFVFFNLRGKLVANLGDFQATAVFFICPPIDQKHDYPAA